MKTVMMLAAGGLLAGAGCGPVNPPTESILLPGGKATLTYHTEMLSKGVSLSHSTWYRAVRKVTDVERTELPHYTERISLGHELTLESRGTAERLTATMTPARVHTKAKCVTADGSVVVDEDWSWPAQAGPAQAGAYKSLVTSRFSAVVAGGRIVAVDATGPVKAEAADAATPTVPESEWLRAISAGVFSALADALAYLPPAGAKPAAVWQVERKRVHPYRLLPFHMATGGARWCSEHSTCLLERVDQAGQRRIATVRITGRRVPGPRDPPQDKRVSHLTVTGEMRVDLTGREIIELKITTLPSWISPSDARMSRITWTDTVKLTPE